jgi:cobalt-zinc-cadmium efflux system membrane fusion protein
VKASGPLQLRLTGRLVWDENRTVRMYPPFAGRVVQILVKVGERVAKGQTLAKLASPDFGQAQADARRAQSDFALAEKNLNRLRELNAAGVSSRKDLAAAEADYARADAERARAMAKVNLYGAGDDSVDQTFSLASPIDGVIVERNINPGQELRTDLQLANTPAMFVITDPTRLWVQLDAAENQLAALRSGKKIALRTAAWPDEIFSATLDNISDFIDPATRTVKVRGTVENRERKLKGEMFVTAELEEAATADLQVPERALLLAGGSYFVFVEEKPGRYSRQEVKVDAVRDGVASVSSGVKLGQKVVIEGNLFLHRVHRQLSGGAPA